ncbi:pseudouridine synthase [Athelia psychrophila]|uniref:Pseudouridine synthase n=1 Tax=Athelia psychrophila TaxID=1759441 RepID=A0A166H1E7_9AGAM|nr:pseudouridine synthase [Fibularhizoctonia sp. CBS 109695]
MTSEDQTVAQAAAPRSGLKKIAPYWYPYTTMAKGRWYGREILEMVSTEFRDRSMEYYRYALESGVTTINGKIATPGTIIRNGDRIENVVHRHEPPVTSTPVKIVLHDIERDFIVINKPGSIPVHASGRYFRHSLVEILKDDFGFKKAYTINRLDRLTSGIMIIPLTSKCATKVSKEFIEGTIHKEYIARCNGEFPAEEVVCEEPLLTVDRQMGLNIVHPEGKPAKTVFNRMHYDANTNTSVLHCQPLTGRSHQIRVHLQFLGHSVANDPVYSEERIWGPNMGKGGIDIVPSDERSAPEAPSHLVGQPGANPDRFDLGTSGATGGDGENPKLMPRETGHDIGMGSPVPLSAEAVGVITRLRNMKDEDEDWGRWRDVVFHAKGKLAPHGMKIEPPPPQNRRKRGGPAFANDVPEVKATNKDTTEPQTATRVPLVPLSEATPIQLTTSEALERAAAMLGPVAPASDSATQEAAAADIPDAKGMTYCPECYLPLHPDPKPERLYIFLHALRYTTSMGKFETDMPEWAAEGWEWDRS